MTHRQCGPGLLATAVVGAPVAPAAREDLGPWWYDGEAHQIVRYSDDMRWDPNDVPELRRSIVEHHINPVVDVDKVDQWVREQPARRDW